MALNSNTFRPLARLKPLLRHQMCIRQRQRRYASLSTEAPSSTRIQSIEDAGLQSLPHTTPSAHQIRAIKLKPPQPSIHKHCPHPIQHFESQQIAVLDPTGARTKLFSKANPEAAKVGDILLVRTKSGDPFAGVCINIRRRGLDTGILLRGQLTRIGVEMWYKIYSPNVEGIEVVQRREKRARRARLYYMRKPKHDVGSVEGIVRQYHKQRAALGSRDVKGRDANSDKKKNNKRGRN
ncbi:MAG: hypothetical protein M1820_008242 [Bogoriella megaspora]|nr:MAG: hypothetical protein M1820_008242 [Bogoriella megaspora]